MTNRRAKTDRLSGSSRVHNTETGERHLGNRKSVGDGRNVFEHVGAIPDGTYTFTSEREVIHGRFPKRSVITRATNEFIVIVIFGGFDVNNKQGAVEIHRISESITFR